MSRQALLARFAGSFPLIAPSLLKCDFGRMDREIERLESGGARLLHLDVMDGHFVPNLSYGALVIERLRELTELPFDAHLMISEPARYLDDFLVAGCNSLTVHLEAVPEPRLLLERIRQRGAIAGLAINPKTPVESLEPLLDACDQVLVMSVEPGFGGQKFIPSALDKLRWVQAHVEPGTLIGIDGGIGPGTIEQTAQAGANVFVVGSAIFGEADYGKAIAALTHEASSAIGTR
jgi:ribulose-phosphate 3-epimerase